MQKFSFIKMPSSSFADYILDLLTPYARPDFPDHLRQVPPDPEQTFFLGNRYADYGLAILFAFAFPLLRAVLGKFIYTPLGKTLMKLDKGKKEESVEKLRKWNESSWKMTVYVIFTVLAFVVSFREKWFSDTRFFWLGCTHFPPCNMFVTKGVLLFFAVETGFYLQAIHFLTFIEVRRKDWLESMIHHIVTVGLLVYAYYVNFTRIGIIIMLLHDISDIFLEAAKLSRYCRRQNLSFFLFVLFFVSWVACRIVYFPFVIIRSTLVEAPMVARLYQINPMPHYAIFNGLLLVLLALHIFWTWLILLVLVNNVKNGNKGGDIREGDIIDKDD